MTTPTTFETVISLNGEDYHCFCELEIDFFTPYLETHEHFGRLRIEEVCESEIELSDFSGQLNGVEITDGAVLRALRPLLEQQIDKNHFEIVEKVS